MDDLDGNAALWALIDDYIAQSDVLNAIPMACSALTSQSSRALARPRILLAAPATPGVFERSRQAPCPSKPWLRRQ